MDEPPLSPQAPPPPAYHAVPPEQIQAVKDDEHLRLLSIFHYVWGGLLALFSLFPLIHLVMGIFFLAAPDEIFSPPPGSGSHSGPPPGFKTMMGTMFVAIPAAIILIGEATAVLTIVAGRRLAQRRSYTFCFVIACLSCVFVPLGTALGVFTIFVLNRPSVRLLFANLAQAKQEAKIAAA
ncbi:MAG: hypothetical protein R3F11_13695 [Verrucomicrobiales bacterium]